MQRTSASSSSRAGRRPGPILAAFATAIAFVLLAPPGHTLDFRLAGFDVAEEPAGGREKGSAASEPTDGDAAGNASAETDSEVDSLIREFMTTSESIRGREGDDPVSVDSTTANQPALYSVLTATKDDNPLLTRRCKREAAEFSVDRLAESLGLESGAESVKAAARHIQGHIDDIERMGGDISYSQYLRTIANCEEFCAPLVAHLLQCHTLSVARLDHGVVLFDFDRHRVDAGYLGEAGLLTRVAEMLRSDPGLKVFLVGRASKIGNLRYNRRLSAQRTLEVRDALTARGIGEERIETSWFGWEPPQLTAAMAREYGLGGLYERVGRASLNQSVMVILYPGEPGIDAHDHSASGSSG